MIAIDAGRLAEFRPWQLRELFIQLHENRSELRLAVYNDRGQIPEDDPAFRAIFDSGRTIRTPDASPDSVIRLYGFSKGGAVLLADPSGGKKPDSHFGSMSRLQAVRLKQQPGIISLAVLLALGKIEWRGDPRAMIDPPSRFLATVLKHFDLANRVVAYSA